MPARTLSSVAVTVCVLLISRTPPAAALDEFEDPGAAAPDATTYQPAFADVADDHVFAAAIRSIYAGGITQGCDSGARNYCPDLPVTRGQMAAFLTRALGLDVPPAVPGGVGLERMPSTASAHGTRIEVCRTEEISLMV